MGSPGVGDVLIAAGGFVFVLVASGALAHRRRRPAADETAWETIDDGNIVWLRFEVDGIRRTVRTVTAG